MNTVYETRANFGPKPSIMKWGYTGLLIPILTYGAMIWGHSALTQANIAKLRRLNHIATNTTTSVRKSNPSRALEVIFDIQPLHLETLKVDLSSYIRVDKYLDKFDYLYSSKTYTKKMYFFKVEESCKKSRSTHSSNIYY